jgi:hypothetical protein
MEIKKVFDSEISGKNSVRKKKHSTPPNEMHFLVRERGPSDSLRGQEKWPQSAKSLFWLGAFLEGDRVSTSLIVKNYV